MALKWPKLPKMAQNYPKWPKNDARIYALFPQTGFSHVILIPMMPNMADMGGVEARDAKSWRYWRYISAIFFSWC